MNYLGQRYFPQQQQEQQPMDEGHGGGFNPLMISPLAYLLSKKPELALMASPLAFGLSKLFK